MPKFAFFVTPHTGGTFTVFRSLRAELAPRGVELRWMGPCARARLLADPHWAGEADRGEAIDVPGAIDDLAQARAMAARLEAGGYDGVFVNVLSDRAATNLVRHLPERLVRIMIVHNITPGTYAAAASIRVHVHATVCVCQRARDDLCRHHGFRPGRTLVIPNAVTLPDALPHPAPHLEDRTLRVLFLGRIEDASKGVMLLPSILHRLPPTVTLTVAGDGPDAKRLKAALAPFAGRARMLGAVPSAEVPALLARHDALLMPSRFEGMPMALIEAMAMGCVPVASRIEGVTDTIVHHAHNGLLFPMGSAKAAAECIAALAADPAWRVGLAAAARGTARNLHSGAEMGAAYARLIAEVQHRRPAIADPLPFEDWKLPRGLRAGLRTHLPRPVKNALRLARERLRTGFLPREDWR
ncbi:glycosyltransferase family 4 protein [Oceaniglobus roseus]|uniref:glycosyltransferase family 4 protein n=1 Tax=Oceaniglobus roseus TaxID=1737570 RepID=UPI000C7F4A49|nr:glycosyltransferase family 4 protein [Kandeliimicrobium roseum]